MKKVLLCIFFSIILSNVIYAHELLTDEFINSNVKKHPLDMTIEEAIKATKSGNPLDFVVAYKNAHNNKVDPEYVDVGEHDYDEYGEDAPTIIRDLYNNSWDIEDNISNNTIPNSYIQDLEEVNGNKNIKLLVILIVLLIASIIMFVLTKKRISLIVTIIILLIGMFNLVFTRQFIDKHNHIENYVLTGKADKHISTNVSDADRDEFIKQLKLKWDIAEHINNYWLRVDGFIELIEKNEKLDDEIWLLWYENDGVNNENKNKYISNLPLVKYMNENQKNDDIEVLYYGFSYEDSNALYNNIKKYETDNYSQKEFEKNLINKLTFKDYDKSELLFHYLKRISNYAFIAGIEENYSENSIISYFKDWYIEGDEEKDIELPYGINMHYEPPRLEKKDIMEILYTNEAELDHNSKEKQVFVMYYKDSKYEIKGAYVDIEFIKTGNNYVINFNPYELMYNVSKPVVIMTIK